MKTIQLSDKTWQRLTHLKALLISRNYDDVVQTLLRAVDPSYTDPLSDRNLKAKEKFGGKNG